MKINHTSSVHQTLRAAMLLGATGLFAANALAFGLGDLGGVVPKPKPQDDTASQAPVTTGSKSDPLEDAIKAGEWKDAKKITGKNHPKDTSDTAWMLARMRTGVCAMDADDSKDALANFSEAYDMMRVHGLNDNRAISAFFVGEDAKIWKGEPFEQAMMLSYYGILQAKGNSWDNCLAACKNTLQYLAPEKKSGEKDDKPAGASKNGYVTEATDFSLGYLLSALSAQQMAAGSTGDERAKEASDHFDQLEKLSPDLKGDIQAFKAGEYNTVLIVTYGLGPKKEAYGQDNTLTRYTPRTQSDAGLLNVSMGDADATAHQLITDLNLVAAAHRWDGGEGTRKFKSDAGNAEVAVGATLVETGLQAGAGFGSNKVANTAAIAGAGIAAVGFISKATAAAPVTYCDTFPQRVFVIPLKIEKKNTVVKIALAGHPEAKVELKLSPPKDAKSNATMTYVRLPGF